MRIFLTILALIFSLQTWTKADDIKDFQIEGMSIGDSLLEFYTSRQIKKFQNYDDLPSDMKFRIADNEKKIGNYDGLQFFYKPTDKKFKIYSISGHIYCNSKNECNKIFKQIRSDMSKSIAGNKFKKKSYKHIDDKTGKSIGTIYYLNVNGGEISVEHMDWSKNVSWSDNVNVSIHTTEVLNWMRSDYGTK